MDQRQAGWTLGRADMSELVGSEEPDERVLQVLATVKALAQEYRRLTGRPLGVTGEVAEYEVARLLGMRLSPPREAGYDAIDREGRKIQIKGRCLRAGSNPGRLGQIDKSKEFDAVLLVLLDESFDTISIHEAGRQEVLRALQAPGSKSRNERGALSVSQFRKMAKLVWLPDSLGSE